jgi:hypothetical protein
VIDKLEVSVMPGTPLTARLDAVYKNLQKQTSDLYRETIDLRQIGLPALLFLSCRYNKTHKLVLRQAAQLSMNEMAALSEQVFECEANCLRIARVDFAVDVPGIPTKWFREHMRVARKRTFRERGPKEEMESSEDRGRTLYFGSGADLVRVYDKSAERKYRNRHYNGIDPDLISRDWLHTSRDGGGLTRVERQLRSGRIPVELATLERLRKNAVSFNPFAPVTLLSGGKPNPDVRDYPIRHYLEGVGLRTVVAEMGLAGAWYLLSSRSGGNANRIVVRLADFLPSAPAYFQSLDLFGMYQKSVARQLSEGLI